MHPHRRRQNPMRQNLPAQAPSTREPFAPSVQADEAQFPPLQAPHEPGYGGQPPVFVISTFDARPVNAVDFQTRSGSNNDDVGFEPYADLDVFTILAECNYDVQPGRVGVLKSFHILVVPGQGEELDGGFPIFTDNGSSNFRITYDVLVDGVAQEGFSGVVSWDAAFGDIFADCYIIAQEGQRITVRVQGSENNSGFFQCLITMNGNLLQARGLSPNFEPATKDPVPVYRKETTRVAASA